MMEEDNNENLPKMKSLSFAVENMKKAAETANKNRQIKNAEIMQSFIDAIPIDLDRPLGTDETRRALWVLCERLLIEYSVGSPSRIVDLATNEQIMTQFLYEIIKVIGFQIDGQFYVLRDDFQ